MKPILTLAALAVLASATGATAADARSMSALISADQARNAAVVKDDPLEFIATVSTEPAHKTGRSFFTGLGKDAYLIASINKLTGAVRYEVHQTVRYEGQRRNYFAAHHDDGSALKHASLSLAQHGEDICPSMDRDSNLPCAYTKHVRFEVSEDALRRMASAYQANQQQLWNFKFKEKGGDDITGSLSYGEIAGGLQAVEAYQAKLRT